MSKKIKELKKLIKKADKKLLKENGHVCPVCKNKNPAKKSCYECRGAGFVLIIDL